MRLFEDIFTNEKTGSEFASILDQHKLFDISRISKFITKCNTDSRQLKDDEVRIAWIGDSISVNYNDSTENVIEVLKSIFPDANIVSKQQLLGGIGSTRFIAEIDELINFDPDLLIWMEYEGGNLQHSLSKLILSEFTKRTRAEIMILPWTVYRTDMDALAAKDIATYISNDFTNESRRNMMTLANDYNAYFCDYHAFIFQKLWSGERIVDDYFTGAETLHPDETKSFYPDANEFIRASVLPTNYITDDTVNIQGNMSQVNGTQGESNISIKLFTLLDIPQSGASLVNSWVVNNISIDKSHKTLRSFSGARELIVPFSGTGFELSYVSNTIFDLEVYIDAGAGFVLPSTLIQDYASNFYRVGGTDDEQSYKPYKVIIDSHILSDLDPDLDLKMVITSNNLAGDIGYDIKSIDGLTTYGSGNLNTDSSIAILSGQITIPAKYADENNYLESGSVKLDVAQEFTFSIKKTWHDTFVNPVIDNKTKVFKITGLEKGDYVMKVITTLTGQTNLDSFESIISNA